MSKILLTSALLLFQGHLVRTDEWETNNIIDFYNDYRNYISDLLGITNMVVALKYDKQLDAKISSLSGDNCLTLMPGADYRYFWPSGDDVSSAISAAAMAKFLGTPTMNDVTEDYLKDNKRQILSNLTIYSKGPSLSEIEYTNPSQTKLACSFAYRCKGVVTDELVRQLPSIAHLRGQSFDPESICLIGPQNTFSSSDFKFNDTQVFPSTLAPYNPIGSTETEISSTSTFIPETTTSSCFAPKFLLTILILFTFV